MYKKHICLKMNLRLQYILSHNGSHIISFRIAADCFSPQDYFLIFKL